MSDHIDRLLDRARNANAANASGPVANRTRTPAELELTEALVIAHALTFTASIMLIAAAAKGKL